MKELLVAMVEKIEMLESILAEEQRRRAKLEDDLETLSGIVKEMMEK